MSKTDPERIKLTLQEQRLKCAQLEQALFEMCVELEKSRMEIENELSNDFLKILDSADTKITPFMKLFWQEQRKLFTRSTTGVRYHPMIIRFCLSLAAKSPSCYEELCNSGCNDIDVIVLFTSGPHLRHNYHGNKTLETMLSGFVELVGHRLNRPVLLHLCVSCSSYKQRHSGVPVLPSQRRLKDYRNAIKP